jgi:hypothetical protein
MADPMVDEERSPAARARAERALWNGWRWRGIVDGFAVKLEFLCDLDTEREGIVAIPRIFE